MEGRSPDDSQIYHRSRNAGRHMAQELVKWSLAAERAEAPVDARIVMESASEYLTETLASAGQAPPASEDGTRG